MKIARSAGHAISACVVLILLIGCNGSGFQLPSGSSTLLQQNSVLMKTPHPHHLRTWMASEAKEQKLLYVATDDANADVYVYSYPGLKLEGTMTRPSPGGGGLCVDQKGDIFMTGDGEVVEYAHGGTTPIATLSGPSVSGSWTCSVDPTTGNLAVQNYGSTTAVYPQATGNPTMYSWSGGQAYGCAYDDHGNLFVTGGNSSDIAELPKGGTAFKSIALNLPPAREPGGIQWDGKYLAVESPSNNQIEQIKLTRLGATIANTIHLDYTSQLAYGTQFLLTQLYGAKKSRTVLILALPGEFNTPGMLGFWNYPAGGAPLKKALTMPNGPAWSLVLSKPAGNSLVP